jgi:hypothetical protein
MTIPAERLAIVDANGAACFVAGRYQVIVGGCSPSGRATKLGAPGSQQAEFELR